MALINFDIDIDEFLSSCSTIEIKQVIEALTEDGYLNKSASTFPSNNNVCITHQEHIDACNKLMENYYQLSDDECEILKKIANKF